STHRHALRYREEVFLRYSGLWRLRLSHRRREQYPLTRRPFWRSTIRAGLMALQVAPHTFPIGAIMIVIFLPCSDRRETYFAIAGGTDFLLHARERYVNAIKASSTF